MPDGHIDTSRAKAAIACRACLPKLRPLSSTCDEAVGYDGGPAGRRPIGTATEDLNRSWYERNTGHSVSSVQKWVQHPVHRWMAATLDGLVEPDGAVFEAKFMLPWTFSG